MLLYEIQGNLLVRGSGFLLILIHFIACIANGQQVAAFSCQTDSDSPLLRAGSKAELLGEYRLSCSGGTGTFISDVDVFLNANYTGRIIDPANSTTEALMIVGDPATPVLGQNMYQAVLNGANSVRFKNVAVPAPGNGSLAVRIVNLRADTATLFAEPRNIPGRILAFATASRFLISDGERSVGFVDRAFDSRITSNGVPAHTIRFAGAGTQTFQIEFQERGLAVFRKRNTGTTVADPAALAPQASYGVEYGTESGFYLPSAGIGDTGLATSGTRLMVTFTNIPTGVTLSGSVNASAGSTSSMQARLIGTAADGSGPFSPVVADGSGFASIPVVNGTARAVWEVLASDPKSVEKAIFSVAATSTAASYGVPGFTMSLAPVNGTETADATSPIPRFTPLLAAVTDPCGVDCLVAPSVITVSYTAGQAAPAPFRLTLESTGAPLNFSTAIIYSDVQLDSARTSPRAWLTLSPSPSATSTPFYATVDPSGLPFGKYYALVYFTAGRQTVRTMVVLEVQRTAESLAAPACYPSSDVPRSLRANGLTERGADFMLVCVTGTSPITTDVRLTLNTPITSRPNDLLLIVNEPPPFAQVLGSTVFRGVRVSDAEVLFPGVYLPASPVASYLRIANIYTDASRIAPATQVRLLPRLSGVAVSPVPQSIGFVFPSHDFSLRDGGGVQAANLASAGNGKLRFVEGFARSFKIRNRATTFLSPESLLEQNIVGAIYNSETGFYNPNLPSGGGIDMGLATQGTRLLARFTGVPDGTVIKVAVNESGANPDSPRAQLIQTDETGTGPYSALAGSGTPAFQTLTVVSGIAVAAWEYLGPAGFSAQTLDFDFQISGTPPAGASVEGLLGPLSTISTPDATAPLPRFRPSNFPNPACSSAFPCLRGPASIALTDANGPVTVNINSDADPTPFLVNPPFVPWLRVSPMAGATPAQLTVQGDPTGLVPGVYATFLTGSFGTILVTFTVASTGPAGLLLDQYRINFYFPSGENPSPTAVNLSGTPGLNWTATTDVPWLQVRPSGTVPGQNQFSVNASLLPPGEYEGIVRFTAPGAAPAQVLVHATVTSSANTNIISGRVSAPDSSPRPGVTVILSGATQATTVTAADGSYAFPVPTASGPYTVTPSGNFAFTPPAATFATITTNQTANFTAAPPAPTVTGVTPTQTTTQTTTFQVTTAHPSGAANLYRIYFLVNSTTASLANACHGFYDRATQSYFLYNDALTQILGPLTPGANTQIENTNCRLNGTATTAGTINGPTLTFSLNLTLKASLAAAAQNLYIWAQDLNGIGTGWIQSSLYQSQIAGPPTLVSATFAKPNLQFRATDPNNDLARAYFLINSTSTITPNTCHGFYDYPTNAFYLYDDTLTSFVPENFRCAIDTANSGIANDGTLTLALYRKGTLPAAKIYLWLTDLQNLGTGWLDPGITLPAAANLPPTITNSTPQTANSLTQQFTATITDPDSRYDLNRIYFLVNPTPTIPQNSCHGFYDRVTNAVYLYNDTLTAVTTGTPENSQCRVAAAWNNTNLALTITRKGTYTNAPENLYLWAVDFAGNGTGWVQTSTWINGANTPPAIISPNPPQLTGTPQAFTLTARDADGAPDINRIYFLLNTSPNIPQNACHGLYDRTVNQIFLYRDGLFGLFGPLTPGSATTLENSQCTINGAATSVTINGTDLTLNLSVTMKTLTAANAYAWAVDTQNNGTGWVRTAAWSAAANQPPTVVNQNTTYTGIGLRPITLIASDPNGYRDIQRLYFLINSDPSIPQNTCHGFYDRAANAMYLYNDSLTALALNLENSQCRLDVSAFTVTTSQNGLDLILNLKMELKLPFGATPRSIYLWAVDGQNADTGWVRAAGWAQNSLGTPYIDSGINGAVFAKTQETISFRVNDPDGIANVARVYFLVADTPTVTANGCHGFYDRNGSGLYLYNDALTGLNGTQNSQCKVDEPYFPPQGTIWSIRFTLTPAFIGMGKNVYALAVDAEGNSSGWVKVSTWGPIVSVYNAPPTIAYATPSAPTGSPQTFQVHAKDANGYADLKRIYFLIHSTATPTQNSCHGLYDRATNQLFLYDDTLTTLLGPVTPGSQQTAQNSQCTLNGATSALFSYTFDELIINIGLSLKAPFANTPRKVYFLSQDQQNADSGWVQTGTWN